MWLFIGAGSRYALSLEDSHTAKLQYASMPSQGVLVLHMSHAVTCHARQRRSCCSTVYIK